MIWHITKKEFHQHIISFQFIVCFLISLILISISVYLQTARYSKRLHDYDASVANSRNELESIEALSFLQPKICRPPSPGSIFVEGFDSKFGKEVTINHHYIPVEATGGETLNQFAVIYKNFDFSDVVIIFLSLLAFLITYNAISGEKERGLLKLGLANAIPRHYLLLGKYFGSFLTLIFPLLVGVLAGILLLLFVPDVHLSWDLILRIVMFFFTSAVFLSLAILIGILVSSLTHQSFISLIFLMFSWAFFVFIIPQLANYIFENSITVKSGEEVSNNIAELKTAMNRKIEDYRKTIKPQRLWASMMNSGEKGFMLTAGGRGNPPETIEYYRQYFNYAGPLQLELARSIWDLESERRLDLERQANYSKTFSSISPTELYRQAMISLAGTDCANYEHFMVSARRYREQIIDYLKAQGGFSSNRYFLQYDYNPTDVERQLYVQISQVYQVATSESASREKINQARQQLRNIIQQLEEYFKSHPQERRKPDLSAMPGFLYSPQGFLIDLKLSLRRLSLLLFLNFLCFLMAHVAFLRYDVR